MSHQKNVSQQSIFLIFQKIVIEPQQQKVSDDCFSSAQNLCQSSPPGDCPPIVNCSKSQASLNVILMRYAACLCYMMKFYDENNLKVSKLKDILSGIFFERFGMEHAFPILDPSSFFSLS